MLQVRMEVCGDTLSYLPLSFLPPLFSAVLLGLLHRRHAPGCGVRQEGTAQLAASGCRLVSGRQHHDAILGRAGKERIITEPE